MRGAAKKHIALLSCVCAHTRRRCGARRVAAQRSANAVIAARARARDSAPEPPRPALTATFYLLRLGPLLVSEYLSSVLVASASPARARAVGVCHRKGGRREGEGSTVLSALPPLLYTSLTLYGQAPRPQGRTLHMGKIYYLSRVLHVTWGGENDPGEMRKSLVVLRTAFAVAVWIRRVGGSLDLLIS